MRRICIFLRFLRILARSGRRWLGVIAALWRGKLIVGQRFESV